MKSTVLTPQSELAFEESARLVREWLAVQADEWQIAPLDFSNEIGQGADDSAKLLVRQDAASLAFAFVHLDEHAKDVEWRVLGSVTEIEGAARIDLEINVLGVRRPTVPPLGMPKFMAEIVEGPGLVDVLQLSLNPRRITAENANQFVDFVQHAARRLPVIAFSTPLQLTQDEVQRICRRVAGAAHVVVVDVAASFNISDRLGPMFSVYRGAVRVYHPRLSDNAANVPLFLPQSISRINEDVRRNGPFGPRRFADVVVRLALDRTSWPPPGNFEIAESSTGSFETAIIQESPPEVPVAETQQALQALEALEVPPLEPVDALETTLEVSELRNRIEQLESDKAKLLDSQEFYFNEYNRIAGENEDLKSRVIGGISDDIAGASEQDISVLRTLSDALSAVKGIVVRTSAALTESQGLRDSLETLEKEATRQRYIIEGFRRAPEGEEVGPTPAPETYTAIDDLVSYLDAKHGGRIIIHDNARRTLARGEYEDTSHLIACLDLLGTLHYEMKAGVAGAYERFHQERERLHIKYSAALSPVSVGQYGRDYEVQWHGSTIRADEIMHVRSNGLTFEPRRMLALYFFWDEERYVTVVSSGPEKLPTPADYT